MPFTGIYWWVPSPAQTKTKHIGTKLNWAVMPFFDHEQTEPDENMHCQMWQHVLDRLARDWRKPGIVGEQSPIADAYTALPRGRIAVPRGGGFHVYHGENNPSGTEMEQVLKTFQIRLGGKNQLINDEHELVLADDLHRLQTALGIKLPVKVSVNVPGED